MKILMGIQENHLCEVYNWKEAVCEYAVISTTFISHGGRTAQISPW